MKSFVAILALVAVAAADVRSNDADAVIVKQDADVFPDQYQYAYETSNGIAAQESGVLKNVGKEDEAISVAGSNSYTGPDGLRYAVTYVADENGYQPQGEHLPTPVPVPDYILKALAFIAANPPRPEPSRA